MPVNRDHILRSRIAHGRFPLLFGLIVGISMVLCAGSTGLSHVADEGNDYVCITEHIPTSWGFEQPPVTIEKHSIEFTDTGRSTPGFYFRNLATSPLHAFAAVIRYTDKQGRTIDDVPIVAGTEDLSHLPQVPFVVEMVQRLKHPIARGEEVIVAGGYDGIRTGTCPAHATVTFLGLQFARGKVLTFSAPGWHIRPMPRSVPNVPESFANLNLNPPDFLLAKLKVDIFGHVTDLISDDGESPEVIAWLRNFMQRSWKFYPSLRDGRPVDSEVRVLFGFPRDRKSMLAQAPSVKLPVLVIQIMRTLDFNPGAAGRSEFAVTFGGMAEGDVLGGGELVVPWGAPSRR